MPAMEEMIYIGILLKLQCCIHSFVDFAGISPFLKMLRGVMDTNA